MTSIELLANPSNDVSTYRWNVSGLKHLNRKNKLTSLPFWTPNHVMKKHQFRCVLIRGVVAKGREEDDYIALLLELIPPPTGEKPLYPGGCSVTARVVNRVHESRVHDIEQVEAFSFSAGQLQACFPELIPPTILSDPEFTEGDGDTLSLDITIQTGVNPTVEWANKTAFRLWGSLSQSVNTMMRKFSKAYDEARVEYGTHVEEKPQSVPWDNVPENWVGREKEWRHLIAEQIVEDEGTFRYGPNRGFSKDEEALLLQCGLNQRLITNTHSLFNYDNDVHAGLLAPPRMRQQRYNMVPGKIKEEVFWANYFWKVAALSLCKNDEQVRMLLTVLNAPPAVKPRDMSAIRTVDEKTVLEHIKSAQEAADMLIEYLTDDAPYGEMLVAAAAGACEGQVKLLDGYFKRTDLSEEALKLTGVVLKRLRERLAEYSEWKKTHVDLYGHAGEYNNKNESDSNADQSSISKEGEKEKEKNHSPVSLPASSTSEPKKDADIDTTRVPPTVTAEASGKKSEESARTDGIDFPLMPWEEENDD